MAAEECGSGARKLALELEEQDVAVMVMLLHARNRELRCCGELSTATRRWRPMEARGSRGARERAAGERKEVGAGRRRRVGTCRSWRWSLGCGTDGEQRWQERNRGGSGGDRGRRSSRCQWDLFAISKNFRDLLVK
jgi:hypothetical protein